ncbi:MAG: helix-turn-helix domain-containing protein [Epsilonproteobacteria bacterium]|nr:helix-turn-helix domain-containing protein [Campylobacterota bacterium]
MSNFKSPFKNPGSINRIIKDIAVDQAVYFEVADKTEISRAMKVLKSYQPRFGKSLTLSLNHCNNINTHEVTLLIQCLCTSDQHVKSDFNNFPVKERKKIQEEKKSRGEKKSSKLSLSDIDDIKTLRAQKVPVAEIAGKYAVSRQTIYSVVGYVC